MKKPTFLQADCSTHLYIPALPFSSIKKIVRKSLKINYIIQPITLGEKIRNKRLELGWLQKDVALFFGVCEDSITGWENNRSAPRHNFSEKIEIFLKIKVD